MAVERIRELPRELEILPEWQATGLFGFCCERKRFQGSSVRSNRRATPHGRQPAGKSVPEMNKEKKVNSRNIIRVTALGIACLMGTAGVRAQGTAAAGSASGAKVGVINVR